MATSLSNLLALLSLDASAYYKELDNSRKKTDSFADKLTKGFNAVGGAVVGGLALAAGATAGFLASSIEPASDLNETISKTTVVFGESSKAILDWGQSSATALGMSQNTALGAASTFGNLFRAMDISEEQSANMSTSIVELAADLASFNNMDPTEVLDKLRAGISGESEPLKTLGVNINQAMIENKAMEMGLWDGVDALTAAEKAQASYALIMEQTTLAQGDFARTSDGLANQQRILTAGFEDLKAKIGTAVLPIANTFMNVMLGLFNNSSVQKGLQVVTEWLQKISDAFAEGYGFANSLSDGLVNVLFALNMDWAADGLMSAIMMFNDFKDWLSNNQGVMVGALSALGVAVLSFGVSAATAAWTAMAPLLPVLAVMLAIGAVAYLVYEAWTNNWGGIRDTVSNIWSSLQPVFENLRQWLSEAIPAALQWMSDTWSNVVLPAIQAVWSFLQANVFPILGAIADVVSAVLEVAFRAWIGYIQNVTIPQLQVMWAFFKDKILPVIKDVAGWLNDKLGPAFKWVGEKIGDVVEWLRELASKLRNIELPDWMTPGSPTPWEIGLLGVQNALDSLSRSSLPQFETALALQPVPVGAGGVNLQPAGQGAGPNGMGGADQDPLLREVYRMLRDLPNTIARANRDAFEKVRRE